MNMQNNGKNEEGLRYSRLNLLAEIRRRKRLLAVYLHILFGDKFLKSI